MISFFVKLSSPLVCPAKSYRALYVGSLDTAGAAGGGGGGGTRAEEAEAVDAADSLRAWLVPLLRFATGCGIGTTRDCAAAGWLSAPGKGRA